LKKKTSPKKGVAEAYTPLVSIIMPVYNGERFIKTAIESIIFQSYDNIELIIIDGSSTDDTLEILEQYSKHITYLISEKDNGMYGAINKGFSIAKGDILCWLNSDDFYFPLAIQNVVETFNTFNDVMWLTGRKVIINKDDQIIKIGCLKNFYRFFIKKGFYRGNAFGFITQEATFWRRALLNKAGDLREDLKVASDFELWTRFAEYAELYSLNTMLAAFRSHEAQLSSDVQRYSKECDGVKPIRFKRIIKLMGKIFYLLSMISSKNKIIFTKDGKIKKIKRWSVFE
jgi:glycosyltransferase involved in cell wall biosynthesis